MKTRKINFIEAAMKYKEITIVVTALLVIFGIYSLMTMPRAEDPKIDMPVAMVYAFYPGADEIQTEKQVTEKLEQYLFSFEEVDKRKTRSQTKDGQVFVTVELYTSVKDRKLFWSTLQHGINSVLKPNLPPGVQGPIVNSNFSDVSAQIISISSATRNYQELDRYLDKVEDYLKTIPEVSKINRSGEQKEQIYVTIDDQKMQQYGFGVSTIANVLQSHNVTSYSGEVTLRENTIPVFTNSQYASEKEIAEQIVYTTPEGVVVRLKDVAKVERRYEEETSYIRLGSERAMLLSIAMQPGNNIVAFGENIDGKLAELKKDFPGDIKIETIFSQPKVVEQSVSYFMLEFGLAISGVVIVVMLLLPFRMAAVSSLAAPIAVMVTFGVMNMIGIELHQVSLAGLIIVLGMLVDDAVVVVDNYIDKLDEGITPWQAAYKSAKQLALSIFTATLAIIFAFLPLALFMEGIAKDFMASLPVTIAVALTASLLIALFLTPYMCYVFIKKGLHHGKDNNKPQKKSLLDHMQELFDRAVTYCFTKPKTTLGGGVLAIVLAFVIAGNVQQEFFPVSERDQFSVELWLPNGTSLAETERATMRVEEILREDSRIVEIASFIGTSSPRFQTSYSPENPRRNFAQLLITTESNKATDELVKEYRPKFEGFLKDGYVRFKQLSLQEGAPIAIRVIGNDTKDQRVVADQIIDILENAEGTNWVRSDYEQEYMGVSLKIKENAASRLGVTNEAITQTLGVGLKGYSVSKVWEGDNPIDIFMRLDDSNRDGLNNIENLHVTSSYGTSIPIKEIAEVVPSWHTGVIARRNGLRTLTVLSEAQLGIKAATILKNIAPQIEALDLPTGISIAYGGDAESSADNMPGMITALSVSILLIFLTLLFQFKTLVKALIVLSTFLLSLLGAFLGLWITGNPMGMTAFMGIIALIGIVVRNGIILVDFTDELIKDHDYSIRDAALTAAKRRMRPIFLTSAAGAVGLIPMIVSKSPLWSPLGSVLAFGLLVSMVLTLFVIPVIYYRFIKPESIENDLQEVDQDSILTTIH
ncbi:efflux RND transporter permease subunit [Algoriphagus sp. Y33]|uniref:efflux RND transporter permease subunit n=1 Tax=Algoriphagus sp. Y33 TaxID=2772483 RepID=UPI001CE18D77|nr:efflux RND transporter permease subunit [Algoriphagus sp. Y33]